MIKELLHILVNTLRTALRTTLWLLRIMIPVTILVRLLQYVGVIDLIATWLTPIMQFVGLPGRSAIAFLSGALVGTHAGLAAMLAMPFTLREATIIAVMICLCHALLVEGAVLKSIGSSFVRVTILRVCVAFVAAGILNLLLPEMSQMFGDVTVEVGTTREISWDTFLVMLQQTGSSILKLSLMMVVLIYLLLFIKAIITHFHWMDVLARPLRPIMRLFGLPENAAYLWIVGNVVGLSYGCGVIKEFVDDSEISRADVKTVSYHLALNHSMVEDTVLFAGFGVPPLCIIVARVTWAIIAVWGRCCYYSFTSK